MGRRNRFVKPKVIRLEISDGDWIDVKRELTVGERKDMYSGVFTKMSSDGESFDVDASKMAFSKVSQYLVGWSLEKDDENGEAVPVELSLEAIRSLDDATFNEIEKAIDEHVAKLEKEKNAQTGGTKQSSKS